MGFFDGLENLWDGLTETIGDLPELLNAAVWGTIVIGGGGLLLAAYTDFKKPGNTAKIITAAKS